MGLNRPNMSSAPWSQETIAVAVQSMLDSDRKLDSYPVLVMPAEPASIYIVDDDASVRKSIEQLLDMACTLLNSSGAI